MPVFSTGFLSPTTNGTPATYDGSATEFTNASSAYSSNDSYATVVDNSTSYFYQSYGGFGINLNSSYIIKGFEVAVEGKTSTGNSEAAVLLEDASSNWTSVSCGSFSTTEATLTYGGSTTLPSGDWTATGLLDANFHVIFRSGSANDSRTISLDHIKINVYYDTGPNLSDTITITESRDVRVFYSSDIDKSDTITVTESITSVISLLSVSVVEFLGVTDEVYDANDGITYDTGTVYDDIIFSENIQNQSTRYSAGGRPKAVTERHGA